LYSIISIGGRWIILVVVLRQLPPILDRLTYAFEGHAKKLWNLIIIVVILDIVFSKDGKINDMEK